MVDTIYQRLRNAWLKSGVPTNVGATPREIQAFESRYCMRLPAQFRAYLSTVNGMAGGATDESLISFLPIDKIDVVPNSADLHSKAGVEIVFAEYLIFSHYYAMRVTKNGDQDGVYAADGTNQARISSSFDEFLYAYLSCPETVIDCF